MLLHKSKCAPHFCKNIYAHVDERTSGCWQGELCHAYFEPETTMQQRKQHSGTDDDFSVNIPGA